MLHPCKTWYTLEDACYSPIRYDTPPGRGVLAPLYGTPPGEGYGGGVYSRRRLAACKLWYTPVGDVPHSCKIWYTPGGVVLHTLFDMVRHP